jgi:glycosyltransferase involved in cell wall biosynthesis
MAVALGRDENNEVVFGTQAREGEIPGVRKIYYKTAREPARETHHYVRPLERAVLTGQAVFRAVLELKKQGFVPDIVCGHSGWGVTQFIKDAYPTAPLLGFYEWYYHAIGTDVDFLSEDEVSADNMARVRVKNAAILLDLAACDWGVTPTAWQLQQFPALFSSKLLQLHEGVDTNYFTPADGARLVLPELDLSHVDELVTYVARGMEPYRGFPQFIQALAHIQERRPNCHAVIVGGDRVAYGTPLPDGQSYKDKLLKEVPLDLSRVHFTGLLPYDQYREVLRTSSVHIYLTVPFVLSWSMLEAMAAGCLVLGSDTPPVREVVRDGENGLLVDFFSPEAIAERVDEVLDHPDRMAGLRTAARETIVARYDLAKLLPRQLRLIRDVAQGDVPSVLGD